MSHQLLRVIVGSQAHGLANPDSDFDYRGVYATPTREILSLNYKYKGSTWLEGEGEDNTAWEIGHFLSLAFQCNPTILEVFLAPLDQGLQHQIGLEMRDLFPFIWTPKKAFEAFVGYGKNQQKKFLDKKDNRPAKYAAAHIRTLVNLNELLTTGTFTVKVANTPYGELIRRIKSGIFTMGEIIDITHKLGEEAEKHLEHCTWMPQKSEESRYAIVNEFLLKVRKHFLD